jgi:hypothetical protein
VWMLESWTSCRARSGHCEEGVGWQRGIAACQKLTKFIGFNETIHFIEHFVSPTVLRAASRCGSACSRTSTHRFVASFL